MSRLAQKQVIELIESHSIYHPACPHARAGGVELWFNQSINQPPSPRWKRIRSAWINCDPPWLSASWRRKVWSSLMTRSMASNPRGETVIRISIAIGIIDIIAVILRLYSRRLHKASVAIGDWLIVLSLVPAFSMIAAGWFCSFLLKLLLLSCCCTDECSRSPGGSWQTCVNSWRITIHFVAQGMISHLFPIYGIISFLGLTLFPSSYWWFLWSRIPLQ